MVVFKLSMEENFLQTGTKLIGTSNGWSFRHSNWRASRLKKGMTWKRYSEIRKGKEIIAAFTWSESELGGATYSQTMK